MRIAYLCSQYPYVSHTFVLREVEALRRRGVEIATFSIRRTADRHLLADADRQAAATTYSILPPRPGHLLAAFARAIATRPRRTLLTLVRAMRLTPGGLRGLTWQLFYFAEALVLWDRCRRLGIRRIHCHFANNAADVALLAVSLGGPEWGWSFTMHGSGEFADVGRHRLRQKVQHADLVVCISDFCRSQLMRLVDPEQWGKLYTVHCGVDVDTFRIARPERVAGEPIHVLTVARLSPDKGLNLLVEAVAELNARGQRTTLTIVGDGPERERIEAQARVDGLDDDVEITGLVGQDTIHQYYAAADIFCLPSFAEGVPIVLMEAMATELPVVATRVMGIPELVDDEVSGLLIAPARVDQLVGALGRLASDPRVRRELGTNGRRAVEAGFAEESVTEELQHLLERAHSVGGDRSDAHQRRHWMSLAGG